MSPVAGPRPRLIALATAAALAGASVIVLTPAAQASAPAAPPGCTASTTTASNTAAVPIPTGPAAIASTIVVSGTGTYLQDVDAVTALTHSFSADLDVALTSPAGTVVTLTSDNGVGNDNLFNGTRWDDDANPAGQVPYATNDGLVTDQLYVNLTPVPTLVPEEALAAFVGENPNGTWTLTVSDDDGAGDGGNLASWSLDLETLPSAPTVATTTATQTTALPVPTGPAVVTSTIVVSGAGAYLQDADATTALTHTFAADLDITLASPAGTVVTLTSDNGGGNDNVFTGTVWDDDANPAGTVPYATNEGLVTDRLYVNLTPAPSLVPEEAMGAFIGENPNGTWTLTISDDLAGDGGSLAGWTLDLDTATCPPPPPTPDTTVRGARVRTKAPKVRTGSFKVKSEVAATAEALTAKVTGKVKVTLANGKRATYQLTSVTRNAPLGGKAKLTQLLKGSSAKAGRARAMMITALKAKRSVVVKLRFTIKDVAGNTRVVKKTVKVKRG